MMPYRTPFDDIVQDVGYGLGGEGVMEPLFTPVGVLYGVVGGVKGAVIEVLCKDGGVIADQESKVVQFIDGQVVFVRGADYPWSFLELEFIADLDVSCYDEVAGDGDSAVGVDGESIFGGCGLYFDGLVIGGEFDGLVGL